MRPGFSSDRCLNRLDANGPREVSRLRYADGMPDLAALLALAEGEGDEWGEGSASRSRSLSLLSHRYRHRVRAALGEVSRRRRF